MRPLGSAASNLDTPLLRITPLGVSDQSFHLLVVMLVQLLLHMFACSLLLLPI